MTRLSTVGFVHTDGTFSQSPQRQNVLQNEGEVEATVLVAKLGFARSGEPTADVRIQKLPAIGPQHAVFDKCIEQASTLREFQVEETSRLRDRQTQSRHLVILGADSRANSAIGK